MLQEVRTILTPPVVTMSSAVLTPQVITTSSGVPTPQVIAIVYWHFQCTLSGALTPPVITMSNAVLTPPVITMSSRRRYILRSKTLRQEVLQWKLILKKRSGTEVCLLVKCLPRSLPPTDYTSDWTADLNLESVTNDAKTKLHRSIKQRRIETGSTAGSTYRTTGRETLHQVTYYRTLHWEVPGPAETAWFRRTFHF